MSPDQKGIETIAPSPCVGMVLFTMSPDQKGIETEWCFLTYEATKFTMSPDQKGIETPPQIVHFMAFRSQ